MDLLFPENKFLLFPFKLSYPQRPVASMLYHIKKMNDGNNNNNKFLPAMFNFRQIKFIIPDIIH